MAFAKTEVVDVQEEAAEEASWQAMARAVATPPISIYSTVAEKEEAAIAELAGEFDTYPVDYKFVAAAVAPSFLEEGTASAGNTTDTTDNFADVEQAVEKKKKGRRCLKARVFHHRRLDKELSREQAMRSDIALLQAQKSDLETRRVNFKAALAAVREKVRPREQRS